MDSIYRICNVLAQFLFPSSQSEPEYHQKMNVRVPLLVDERLKS